MDISQGDLEDRIRLVRRTLVVLREGLGRLVVTKGSGDYFEFWVQSSVTRALPPHRWTSFGWLLDPADYDLGDAEEFVSPSQRRDALSTPKIKGRLYGVPFYVRRTLRP